MPPSTEENEEVDGALEGELEEEGGDEVMHQGFLNLLKGDAANKKFFVLTREFFTYWDTQEDMENGEPQKALIELSGIKEFKETADGFELVVEGQKRTLQLQVIEKTEQAIWVNHWRDQVAESLGDKFQATSTVADAEKAAAEVAAAEAEAGEAVDEEAIEETAAEEEPATAEATEAAAAEPAAAAAAAEAEPAVAAAAEEAKPEGKATTATAPAAAAAAAAAAVGAAEEAVPEEPAAATAAAAAAVEEEDEEEEVLAVEEPPADAEVTELAQPTEATTTKEAQPDAPAATAPPGGAEEEPPTTIAAEEEAEGAEEEEEAAETAEATTPTEAAPATAVAEEGSGEEEAEEQAGATSTEEAPRLSLSGDKKTSSAVPVTYHEGQLLVGEGRTVINVTVSDSGFEVAQGDQSIAKDDITDIQEVPGGFEIHTKSGEAWAFQYTENESDESAWVIALGQMVEGDAASPSPGVPMGSPGGQSATSTAASPAAARPPAAGKKVVGAGLPAGHRKLREIFDLCGPEAISGNVVTRDSFLAACKRSYLVSDFFRLARVTETSLAPESTEKMLTILDETTATGGDPKARITWDAFRQFHTAYVNQQIGDEEEGALEDIKSNSVLHEGPLRIMTWSKLDNVREHADEDWQFNHILFDPASGRAALRQEFAYVKRKFNNPNGKPKKEEPIAAFEEPETAQAAFMDLVSVFCRFYCPVTISYNRKPQQKPGTDEQEEWMKELHGNRVVLIKDTLTKAGIPEAMIRVRLVSDMDAPTHTFIYETNHRVRHIRVHSSMMLYVPKLEGAPQNIRVNADEITAVRWGKAGFRLDLQGGENIEVQTLTTELPAWRSAIDRLCANGKKLRTAVLQKSLSMNTLEQLRNSVKNGPVVVKAGSNFEVPSDMANEFDTSALKAWTAKLPETPTMSGILGLQSAGALTAKYCLLFKDRLDSWNRPIDATQGKKPQGRIPIKEVKEFEIVGSGLVLTVGRRKVGIHTRTAQDLYLWSEALRLAIQECPEASANLSSSGGGMEASPEKKELPPPVLRRKRSDRSILDVKPPHHKQAPSEPAQASLWQIRSGRGVVINTNIHAPESGQLMSSVGDVLIQPRDRPGSASPPPAPKITNFDHISRPPAKDFANKIPGAREIATRSEPGAMRWNKITRHRLGTIRSSTSSQPAPKLRAKSAEPRQPSANIVRDMSLVRPKEAGPPYKITNACRGFEPPPRITSANTFKITEAGRGPTTYMQVRNYMYCGDVDKLRSFGQGSAWAEAQDKRVAASFARKSLSAGPSTSKKR